MIGLLQPGEEEGRMDHMSSHYLLHKKKEDMIYKKVNFGLLTFSP